MKPIVTLLVCVALAGALFVGGCKKGDEGTPGTPVTVKPMEQYREQATKEITTQNAKQELDKLEKEVDSEPAP